MIDRIVVKESDCDGSPVVRLGVTYSNGKWREIMIIKELWEGIDKPGQSHVLTYVVNEITRGDTSDH